MILVVALYFISRLAFVGFAVASVVVFFLYLADKTPTYDWTCFTWMIISFAASCIFGLLILVLDD